MILRMNAPPLLDAAHAGFVAQPGISMTVASRAPGNLPVLGRALGCRVAADRRRVTVLLPGDQLPELVAALRESRAIAAVFSEPGTHRTIQLKGVDAALEPLAPGDAELSARWADGFVAAVAPYGIGEPLVRAFLWCEAAALLAVSFTPCAAFQQTPGPRAGTPLAA
jgi:hypothetical protein